MSPWGSMLPAGLYDPAQRSPFPAFTRSASVSETSASEASAPAQTTLAQKFMQGGGAKLMLPSASEGGKRKIELYSGEFYAACTFGGVLSCGLTHTAVTPLDVVKCNSQIDPVKYKGIANGFRVTIREGGLPGVVKGWVPTLLGYSVQGAGKFGLYEFFKKYYADLVGEEFYHNYKTAVYLAGSASAEFFADIGLCPFEAVKVKVQTSPGFAKGLADGMPKFIQQEGVAGLWKGIVPLWGRQIPYTMMKFACFENTVVALYKYVVPKPKEQCNKVEQLGVSFAAGYIAGVFCAVVSHPADNLVSKLNSMKGASVGDIVKEMGWFALFTRGLTLRIIMVGTLTGLQWGIYDAFKVYVGLPTTGAAPAPDKKGLPANAPANA